MLGKTHMVVGMACGLAVMQPDSVPMLVAGTGAAALGALIPDIDVGTSQSHKDANIIVYMSIAVVALVALAERFLHLDIYNRLLAHKGLVNILIPSVLFIIICAFGKEQPHRSFMHSILALVLLTGCLWYLFPTLSVYFAIGFASHIITDLFNRKKVRLLYPLPGGVALGLFHAHGTANTVLFVIGSIATVASLVFCMGNILRII